MIKCLKSNTCWNDVKVLADKWLSKIEIKFHMKKLKLAWWWGFHHCYCMNSTS